jgi:methylated-DNA-protein-cysteine methyltransferase-like protein
MTGNQDDFRIRVYQLVAEIPAGRVMTYGDIAAYCGIAYAARIVGGLAHFGPSELPWHRVVNRFGGLASGFPGGREVQAVLLKTENIECQNDIIQNFKDLRWSPNL